MLMSLMSILTIIFFHVSIWRTTFVWAILAWFVYLLPFIKRIQINWLLFFNLFNYTLVLLCFKLNSLENIFLNSLIWVSLKSRSFFTKFDLIEDCSSFISIILEFLFEQNSLNSFSNSSIRIKFWEVLV